MNKKLLQSLVLTLVALTGTLTASAQVWRVNNNTGVNADFTQLNTAVASPLVQPGDTIYVEGTAAPYSGPVLTKKLVIIGPGYFLSENEGLQALPDAAIIGGLIVDSAASGSTFIGISGALHVRAGTDDLTLERCSLSISHNGLHTEGMLSQNWVVNKCYVSLNYQHPIENIRVTNCITFSSGINLPKCNNGLVRNNTFFASGINITNSYISNNLFLQTSSLTAVNSTVRYNISTHSTMPAGDNNRLSVPLASLIVNTGSTDGRFQLKEGSPAIGAGEPIGGETPDCGAFGTADPYRLSGIPPIPTIYQFVVPASIESTATTLPITISTRSNN